MNCAQRMTTGTAAPRVGLSRRQRAEQRRARRHGTRRQRHSLDFLLRICDLH